MIRLGRPVYLYIIMIKSEKLNDPVSRSANLHKHLNQGRLHARKRMPSCGLPRRAKTKDMSVKTILKRSSSGTLSCM